MGDLIPVVGQVWTSYYTGTDYKIISINDLYIEMIDTVKLNGYTANVATFSDYYILTKLAPSQLS